MTAQTKTSSNSKRAKAASLGQAGEEGRKQRILAAATKEFSANGMAGARIYAIAASADVNVALIFYYFKSKDKLFAAVLEQIFTKWHAKATEALDRHQDSVDAILAYVGAQFDLVSREPDTARLVQQEKIRPGTTSVMARMAEQFIRPV